MNVSRRFVAAGLCSCFLCAGGAARARPLSLPLSPAVPAGYRPADTDERGLWQDCEKMEEAIAGSSFLMQAPDLQSYTEEIVGSMVDGHAKDLRIYLVHDPSFNATMAPNGLMVVHSGLMARARNEAQFASVLGHEAGHYLRRHSVQGFRDRVSKTNTMAFVSAGAITLAGATYHAGGDPRSWIDLATSISTTVLQSIFSFSREQEQEADAYGIQLLDRSGYPPAAAGEVWRQLIEERKAVAASRKTRYRDGAESDYSTHPPSEDRMTDLLDTARTMEEGGRTTDAHRDRWNRMMQPYRAALLDEQVKLNNPGASLYLLGALATDGWNGLLHYYEGEVYRLRDETGDDAKAADAYAKAVAFADAPAPAWRAHGYALLKAGRGEEGKQALTRYLELQPDAADAAMVRFSLAQ
jgi:predicted Zn-dependent protease